MSKTASIALAPAPTLFARLFATLDRLLLAYAEVTIRNGDVRAPTSEHGARVRAAQQQRALTALHAQQIQFQWPGIRRAIFCRRCPIGSHSFLIV